MKNRKVTHKEEGSPPSSSSSTQPQHALPRSRRRYWGARILIVGAIVIGLSAAYVGWYAILFILYGPPYAPEIVTVRTFDLPIKKLPDSLAGLRFAQISDLHFNDNNSYEMVGTV